MEVEGVQGRAKESYFCAFSTGHFNLVIGDSTFWFVKVNHLERKYVNA